MWMSEGDGPQWMPTLNAAETLLEIPTNLLARCAFQESTFRHEVILGLIPSSCGALGILQLMPRFFSSVLVPVPFTPENITAQISESAAFLASLYTRFSDWQVAVAAYNWGGGDVHHEYVLDHNKYVLSDMPTQTQNYVRKVFSDVPLAGALL
jgi:soluble lytic murein transglycosylase-like protein